MSRCLNLGSQGCGDFLLTMQLTVALSWKEGDSGYLKYKYRAGNWLLVVVQLLLWVILYGEYISGFISVCAHYGDTNIKTRETPKQPHSALAEFLLILYGLVWVSLLHTAITLISTSVVCFTAIAVSCWSRWPCELPRGSVLLLNWRYT